MAKSSLEGGPWQKKGFCLRVHSEKRLGSPRLEDQSSLLSEMNRTSADMINLIIQLSIHKKTYFRKKCISILKGFCELSHGTIVKRLTVSKANYNSHLALAFNNQRLIKEAITQLKYYLFSLNMYTNTEVLFKL